MISDINTYGIMRGGIHAFHSWLISKMEDDSLLYYNNIKNKISQDRLIKKSDTRVQSIKDRLSELSEDANKTNTVALTKVKYRLKSYESRWLSELTFPLDETNIFIIRNPYNNLASSIAYVENGGKCKEVRTGDDFISMWKQYAMFILKVSKQKGLKLNFIIVIYDMFISDDKYRNKISKLLNEEIELKYPSLDDLNNRIYMGGGSSFKTNNYHSRYHDYMENELMKKLINDREVHDLWDRIITELYYFE